MKRDDVGIRTIVFQDGDLWVAQCLEYDIGAQAHDPATARRRLRLAMEIERRTSLEIHGEDFAGIEQAPKRFFEMWEKQSREFNNKSKLNNNGKPLALDLALCA